MSCQKHTNFCNSIHNSFYVQTAQQVLTIGATFARHFVAKNIQKSPNLVTLATKTVLQCVKKTFWKVKLS